MQNQNIDPAARQRILANQEKMQRLVADRNAEISRQNDARLGTELFPADKISDRWKAAVKKAKRKSWPTSMGIPINLFAIVVKVDPERDPISLFAWGVMNNMLEWTTLDTLEMTEDEYHDFVMTEVWPNMQTWREIVMKIRGEIEMTVAAEYKARNAQAADRDKLKAKAPADPDGLTPLTKIDDGVEADYVAPGVVKNINDQSIGQA